MSDEPSQQCPTEQMNRKIFKNENGLEDNEHAFLT